MKSPKLGAVFYNYGRAPFLETGPSFFTLLPSRHALYGSSGAFGLEATSVKSFSNGATELEKVGPWPGSAHFSTFISVYYSFRNQSTANH